MRRATNGADTEPARSAILRRVVRGRHPRRHASPPVAARAFNVRCVFRRSLPSVRRLVDRHTARVPSCAIAAAPLERLLARLEIARRTAEKRHAFTSRARWTRIAGITACIATMFGGRRRGIRLRRRRIHEHDAAAFGRSRTFSAATGERPERQTDHEERSRSHRVNSRTVPAGRRRRRGASLRVGAQAPTWHLRLPYGFNFASANESFPSLSGVKRPPAVR